MLKRGMLAVAVCLVTAAAAAAQKVDISWGKVDLTSKMTPTLQVVVNPPLRPGSPIHDRAYSELKNLGADYVRYVPWLPYPKLGVAELEPPSNGKTSWDFSLIDPMTIDFLKATEGHPVILNFSTIPAWMFKTPKPIEYPADPNTVTWNYTQGTELRDPSMKELGDYYARLVSWYVNGGFTDELGKRHDSGHHFRIPYWEIFNEVDFEHSMTAQQYTARYDAIVSAVKQVAPETKFVGLALAMPSMHPEMFEYFLNPANHKPGIPLDMISYHFYAAPAPDETPEIQQHTFFAQADGFLNSVRYIEEIRKRLSPQTATTVDEIGCISADDSGQGKPGHVTAPIPDSYWNLCAATYAYVFGHLASLGIDIAGESQLVGYPTQFPSVTMLDWNTGAPNARFRVLELLKNNFGPGDRIVETKTASPEVYALAFDCRSGQHNVLLINKRDHDVEVVLPQKVKLVQAVDETTKAGPVLKQSADSGTLRLRPYAVTVATLE
jgi:Glycosyl hydrolases family 39